MPPKNKPDLVAKALAKAQSVEQRLNAVIAGLGPESPSIMYSASQTVVTFSTAGDTTWTAPAGVTSAMVECYAAGGGGEGSSATAGGSGGGGGEYAAEPARAVVPGTVYAIHVGAGGTGGLPGSSPGANDGDDTSFDSGNGPYANGGLGGGATGGAGGTGSGSSISFDGGEGGSQNAGDTGGAGGGGGGGNISSGGPGLDATGSTGKAGGAGGGSGATGGTGGNNALGGANGTAPGGGGGGCGASSGTGTIIKTYSCTGTRSYYGSDGQNPNAVRSTGGTCWQGGETAGGGSYNGTQKFICTFPTTVSIISDFAGATMTSAKFTITNQHTYFNSGMNVELREWRLGGGAPSSWNGSSNSILLGSGFQINKFQRKTFSLGATAAAHFGAGTTFGIAMGPGPKQMDTFYYGYFAGGSGPSLTLSGTTAGSPVAGGNGADGQVVITYTTPSAVIAAVQPQAVTDAAGNQVAQGFTGPITAFQPGASPSQPETWQIFGVSLPTGVTGTCRYRMMPENHVEVHVNLAIASSVASGTLSLITLPSGYIPSVQSRGPVGCFTNSETTVGAVNGVINMRWSAEPGGFFGVRAFAGGASGSGVTELDFIARYPLD